MEKDNQAARAASTCLRRIAVTGPESTGKSTLSTDLARYFDTVWVKEYAREYIDQLNRPYEEADLLTIAKGQLQSEEAKAKEANRLLICDTELSVIKIWSEFKYNRCHPWILERLNRQHFDLYLLTATDLPWEEDPQREHPHQREELFKLYEKELKSRGAPYIIIRGNRQQRLQQAIRAIEPLLS
jgi:NadR type nicotinamide-nucleotide adenylyltransferase